jgi:putative methionine-R-sulfoxide reductase with GAF domain
MEPIGPQTASSNRQLKPLPRSRRQSVRQRVHSPAYASLNGTSDDMVLDLSEILDISERGAAIQTSSTWSVNRVVNLCLDLSETETYLQTSGRIIWADRKGRIGVRFSDMAPDARRKLQEWLFLNAMIGAANYVARHAEAHTDIDRWNSPPPKRVPVIVEDTRADYTSTLAALAAVQREVEAHGTNLTGALQLIAERCCTFTRANGAAIALLDNSEMVCRASSGDAPPVGATLDIGSGFSGYCARTGFLQRCDDTDVDPRVDRESCRMLGIRSIIAVPIRMGDKVVGLLEVFSSKPRAFNERDGTVLQRLADTVLAANNRATRVRTAPVAPQPRVPTAPKRNAANSITFGPPSISSPPSGAPVATRSYPFASALQEPDEPRGFRIPQRHLVLLLVAASSIVIVLGYLLAPWVAERFHPAKPATVEAAHPLAPATAPPSPPDLGQPMHLADVRKRAELGDPYEQVALATRYATGEDVPQDYSMALRWFLKAAEQGHVGAQDTLGAYYYLGRGAQKNITRAYFWSVLARAAGKSASKDRVAFMSSQLTRAQAFAIQREANTFLKLHPPLMNSESSY